MQEKAQRYVQEARQFFREYTAGLNVRDLRRLFDRDAARVYEVLARDQEAGDEPEESERRFLHRLRVVFLGLSYKLSPARRVLFVAALVFTLLALISSPTVRVETGRTLFLVESSPLWFLLAVGALLWLLAMELVDRVRVRDELEVARKLQGDLLPDRSPEIEGWGFAHAYRTANEVGGDYYDFQPLEDGRLALMIGDASGHGIAAGLLMAIANATLKTAIDLDPEPRAVAELLNRALLRTGDRRAFMTLFYALLDPASGRLDFVGAGHPYPLLRRAGGEIRELGEGSLPLGMRRDLELPVGSVTLDSGDLLLLYTDGLPEAVDAPDGEAFGFTRLRELLSAVATPQAVLDRVLLAFDRHVGEEPLRDDLTLVVVARYPEIESA